MPTGSIQRLHRPPTDELHARFVARSEPAVITGVVERWPAFERWTLDYLASCPVAAEKVHVATHRDGNLGDLDNHRWTETTFRDHIRWVAGERESPDQHYLIQALRGPFAPLLDDLEIPDHVPPDALEHVNLWIGKGGHSSPLHIDYQHNLLAHVRGRKHVRLYAPDEHRKLYPHPSLGRRAPHLSQIDPVAVDRERFPRFAEARPLELVLEAGEILFIPSLWWHHVVGEGVNVSVNFWWTAPLAQRLSPPVYLLRRTVFDLASRGRSALRRARLTSTPDA